MSRTVKIDHDEPLTWEAIERFEQRRGLVEHVLPFEIALAQVWRTRRGAHIVCVTSRDVSPIEIILLQALLGSDYKREIFNYARVLSLADAPPFWRSDDRWNVLYSEKHIGEPEV